MPGVARPQQVFALSINGNPVTSDVIAMFEAGMGFIIWKGGRSWPSGNYEMWLSHGMPFVPGDLRQAILALSRGNQEQRTRFVQGLRQSSAASPHRVRTPDGRGSRHNRRQRAIRESLGS